MLWRGLFACGIFCLSLPSMASVPLRSDAPVTGKWRILVLPVEFDEWRHDKPLGPDNPWEHPKDIAEIRKRYNDLASDYYRVTSQGKVELSFEVFDRWLPVGRMSRYAGNPISARRLLDDAIAQYERVRGGWAPEADFDKTVVAFAAPSWADEWAEEWNGTGWEPDRHFIHSIASPAGRNGKAIALSAGAGIGVLVHELGHALFSLKDKEYRRRIPGYRFQLMGAGAWNGADLESPETFQANDRFKNTEPALVSPWNRINLGWEHAPLRLGPGNEAVEVELAPAASRSSGTNTRIVAMEADGERTFLFENRARIGWDRGLPDWGLLVWSIRDDLRANTDGDSDYGRGVWESVIDMHPETRIYPQDFRYAFLDGRTRSFDDFTDAGRAFFPRGLFDAPLRPGERSLLEGTAIEVRVKRATENHHLHVEFRNVRRLP